MGSLSFIPQPGIGRFRRLIEQRQSARRHQHEQEEPKTPCAACADQDESDDFSTDVRFESVAELEEFLCTLVNCTQDDPELGEAAKWLQKAIKRPGRCSGDKFGSSDCPPGSPQYNLAKRLKKGGDLHKKVHS